MNQMTVFFNVQFHLSSQPFFEICAFFIHFPHSFNTLQLLYNFTYLNKAKCIPHQSISLFRFLLYSVFTDYEVFSRS